MPRAAPLGGVRGERLGRLSRPDAAAVALEELNVELAAEGGKRGGDGRLADMELRGGALDAPGPGDGEEGAKLRERDRHAHRLRRSSTRSLLRVAPARGSAP